MLGESVLEADALGYKSVGIFLEDDLKQGAAYDMLKVVVKQRRSNLVHVRFNFRTNEAAGVLIRSIRKNKKNLQG